MTVLTDFQNRKLTYFFNILDINGDGFLNITDVSEMSERVRSFLDLEDGSKDHKRIADKAAKFFHTLLKDINSAQMQIQLEEWLEFFADLISGDDEDEVDSYKELIFNFMFDFFDKNRDGFIQRDEYMHFFRIFGIDEDYLDKSMYVMDANHDNRLSRYEILTAIEDFIISDDKSLPGNWIFGNWETMPQVVDL